MKTLIIALFFFALITQTLQAKAVESFSNPAYFILAATTATMSLFRTTHPWFMGDITIPNLSFRAQ